MSKQAVLLIHGIGDQKPMSTLRGFVDAVWTRHTAIHHRYAGGGMWSKPDSVSGSFELRRLTTPQNAAGIETDFFEFYWAHLMEGTSQGHVWAWVKSLLLRGPGKVPAQLKGVYWLLLLSVVGGVVLLVYSGFALAADRPIVPAWVSVLGGISVVPLARFIVNEIVGDAARYLHVAPTNIQRRHEIREAGIALLKALHEPARNYDRILIVGHSLGSVIGYDVLTSAWVDFHKQHTTGTDGMKALAALEALALTTDASPETVQTAQRRYFEELKVNGNKWRVTDFVTIGSPLAHAAILLANDQEELERKQKDREFPRCLPVLETAQRDKVTVHRFSFEIDRPPKPDSYRVPHHAAVFAPTRWTNLFFPAHVILWGDVVGGPLRGVMGKGICDVSVTTRRRADFLTHTKYWSQVGKGAAPHIDALRDALDLMNQKGANP